MLSGANVPTSPKATKSTVETLLEEANLIISENYLADTIEWKLRCAVWKDKYHANKVE
jgi:hypothetical protein